MAVRMAISFSRTDARTSSKLATFAHAIRITTPTAPRSVNNIGRIGPTISAWTLIVSADSSRLLFGYCCASRSAIVFISAPACSTETPAFNRAMTPRKCPPRVALAGSSAIGRQNCASREGK
jgi:hypothetical protein